MITLDTLHAGDCGTIVALHHVGHDDAISRRLAELGFIPGSRVRVLATGPFGRDPIALRIGTTRFALRAMEARRILVAQDDAERGKVPDGA